jgi:catechol 2,3-dioxygenase-like lactoylglutathione lyase family enzyme
MVEETGTEFAGRPRNRHPGFCVWFMVYDSGGGPMPPTIHGVLETCLYVADMARSRLFYETVLGLRAMVVQPRMVAYDLAPGSVLLLFVRGETLMPIAVPGKGTIPPHDGSGPLHLALAISPDDYDPWQQHLEAGGIEIEGEMQWSRHGRSLYFRDPDGHLVELATPGLWENY